MDRNKLKVLREVGYVIRKQCGLCEYGLFQTGKDFGSCTLRVYDHEKHTESERNLSIYRGGSCDNEFKLSDKAKTILGRWDEFVDRRHFNRNDRKKAKTHY